MTIPERPMMRPRWSKVLQDLWSNRTRSILVVLSIGVGLFALGLIMTINVILKEDMRASYSSVNPANVTLSLAGFDETLVTRVAHLESVEQAQALRVAAFRVRASDGQWKVLDISGIEDFERQEINTLSLLEGRWPQNFYEMVIDLNKLDDLGYAVGDVLEVEMVDGSTRTLTLCGIVQNQTIGAARGGGSFFMENMQGYVRMDAMPHLGQPQVYNTLLVTSADGGNNEDSLHMLAEELQDVIKHAHLMLLNSNTRLTDRHPTSLYVDTIGTILIFLGLLIVFLSGSLISNTLTALLNQQREQIGIMKSFGASSRQIIVMYMLLLFILGMLGLMISIPASHWVAYQVLYELAGALNFQIQPKRFVFLPVLVQMVMAFIVPQLAGVFPVMQGTRIKIQDALSGFGGEVPQADTGLSRFLSRFRKLSRPMRISLRNTFRRKGRLILTLVTLSLGGSIFIATFSVRASLDAYIDQVGHYFQADVNITTSRPYRMGQMAHYLAPIPGIEEIEGWSVARCELPGKDKDTSGASVTMMAPPVESPMVEPILISGRWIETSGQNEVALNEQFLFDFSDLGLGDTLDLRVNGEITEWTVVGFFQLAGKSAGYIVYTDYESLVDEINQRDQAIIFRIALDEEQIPPNEQAWFRSQLNAYLEGKGVRIRDLQGGDTLQKAATDGLNIIIQFLMIMSFLTALVGSIGLAGTMSMNVIDRTREIGIMRAIGAHDKVIAQMVIVEGLLIGLMSWLLGALLSFPISRSLSNTISYALFDVPATYTFSVIGFVYWFVIAIILAVIASILPARSATHLTIREAISYE
ncbi:MAG: ABC transporter permease [Anaerolineaceae bacterium]|nr:ABC transporter permease [Anaerolineaceae bacterium]